MCGCRGFNLLWHCILGRINRGPHDSIVCDLPIYTLYTVRDIAVMVGFLFWGEAGHTFLTINSIYGKKYFDGKKIGTETVHIETNGKTIKLLRKPRIIKFPIIKMRFADYKISYKSKFSPQSTAKLLHESMP